MHAFPKAPQSPFPAPQRFSSHRFTPLYTSSPCWLLSQLIKPPAAWSSPFSVFWAAQFTRKLLLRWQSAARCGFSPQDQVSSCSSATFLSTFLCGKWSGKYLRQAGQASAHSTSPRLFSLRIYTPDQHMCPGEFPTFFCAQPERKSKYFRNSNWKLSIFYFVAVFHHNEKPCNFPTPSVVGIQ